MLSILGRWLLRAFLAFAACFVAAYIGDWTIFHLRSSPHSTVTINRYMGVPLKGKKTEYDFLGAEDTPCSVSLFPQSGQDPCWYLKQNPNQWDNL